MLDDLILTLRWFFGIVLGAFVLVGCVFAAAHVADNWDSPEYPYSGFCPECPEHVDYPADCY